MPPMPKPANKKSAPKRQEPKDPVTGFAEAVQAVREDAKAKRVDKIFMREINAVIAEARRANGTAITVHIPKDLLSQIDRLVPSPRYRESFIIAAIRARLFEAPPPAKITKAIAKSTSEFETGSYEE